MKRLAFSSNTKYISKKRLKVLSYGMNKKVFLFCFVFPDAQDWLPSGGLSPSLTVPYRSILTCSYQSSPVQSSSFPRMYVPGPPSLPTSQVWVLHRLLPCYGPSNFCSLYTLSSTDSAVLLYTPRTDVVCLSTV